MENLNEVKEAMGVKRTPKKKDESKKEILESPLEETTQDLAVDEVVDEVVDETVDETIDNREQSSFPGCNTCRNFGSFPAWQPCADCRHNPKNQNSFYQA